MTKPLLPWMVVALAACHASSPDAVASRAAAGSVPLASDAGVPNPSLAPDAAQSANVQAANVQDTSTEDPDMPFGFSGALPVSGPALDGGEPFSLLFARHGCYGPCPVYALRITSDGKVALEGAKPYTWTLDAAAVGRLRAALTRANVWTMLRRYPATHTDGEVLTLKVALGPRTHAVQSESGAQPPAAFTTFVDDLDRLSGMRDRFKAEPAPVGTAPRWPGQTPAVRAH